MLSKKSLKLLSFVLCLCFVFTTNVYVFPVCAEEESTSASISEMKDKKEKIKEKISEAQEEIDKLEKQKDETQDTITALDKKISLLKDEISLLQDDIDELKVQIADCEAEIAQIEQDIITAQNEIDAKQAEFDRIFAEYCQRLKAMYISGSANNLEVLLTSIDISSILTRSQMIKSVSEQDSRTLDDLMKKMEEIEQAKAELENKRNKLNEDKALLETNKKSLEENMSSLQSSKETLDAEVSKANKLMKKLSSETAEYQESIETNEEELKEVEREIEAAYARASRGTGSISGSVGSGEHSGTLGYPTYSRSVSAGYPNYSSGRYHGGVDFRCPSGTAVCAAADGTVILAKNLNYSYGHHLIIDHGNGLSTLYAHNTTLLVGVGDHVTKGQLIAYSGSTGNSTGPHVHFEVRVNGTRVNPWNYL